MRQRKTRDYFLQFKDGWMICRFKYDPKKSVNRNHMMATEHFWKVYKTTDIIVYKHEW
jgi:hypothetical protein